MSGLLVLMWKLTSRWQEDMTASLSKWRNISGTLIKTGISECDTGGIYNTELV